MSTHTSRHVASVVAEYFVGPQSMANAPMALRHLGAFARTLFSGQTFRAPLFHLVALSAVAWLSSLVQVSAINAAEVVRVKVVVDEEERSPTAIWQRRLRERVDAAAAILNQYANIRFTVAEFGTWRSDNRITDLNKSLRELEQEVEPNPCDIVIAFSSQYQFQKGINGLGGTRGPLHTHILVRETAPNAFEPERLEALVHEMGHFLGAAHSRDPMSAMRPIIGDGRARIPTYRIGFDKQNSQIIQLVGSEMSALHVRRFHQLSKATRDRLIAHYQQLAKELPQDPAAPKFVQMLHMIDTQSGAPGRQPSTPQLQYVPYPNKKKPTAPSTIQPPLPPAKSNDKLSVPSP